jgi:hypothetical protein
MLASPTLNLGGAPLGNQNARKHGLYSKRRANQAPGEEDQVVPSLLPDIANLRAYMQRLIAASADCVDIDRIAFVLTKLTVASLGISRLVRTHLYAHPPDPAGQADRDTIGRVAEEIHQTIVAGGSARCPSCQSDVSVLRLARVAAETACEGLPRLNYAFTQQNELISIPEYEVELKRILGSEFADRQVIPRPNPQLTGLIDLDTYELDEFDRDLAAHNRQVTAGLRAKGIEPDFAAAYPPPPAQPAVLAPDPVRWPLTLSAAELEHLQASLARERAVSIDPPALEPDPAEPPAGAGIEEADPDPSSPLLVPGPSTLAPDLLDQLKAALARERADFLRSQSLEPAPACADPLSSPYVTRARAEIAIRRASTSPAEVLYADHLESILTWASFHLPPLRDAYLAHREKHRRNPAAADNPFLRPENRRDPYLLELHPPIPFFDYAVHFPHGLPALDPEVESRLFPPKTTSTAPLP